MERLELGGCVMFCDDELPELSHLGYVLGQSELTCHG